MVDLTTILLVGSDKIKMVCILLLHINRGYLLYRLDMVE